MQHSTCHAKCLEIKFGSDLETTVEPVLSSHPQGMVRDMSRFARSCKNCKICKIRQDIEKQSKRSSGDFCENCENCKYCKICENLENSSSQCKAVKFLALSITSHHSLIINLYNKMVQQIAYCYL